MKQAGETLPQAAGGFGGSDGSTCWGREEGSVGPGTPTQAPLVPPPPQGWARSPRCWPARPVPPTSLPSRLTSSSGSLVLQRMGKRRHRHGAAWLPPEPLLPPRRHQPPGVHVAVAQWESLLGLPAASRLLPSLHSRLFFPLNASHTPPTPAAPWEIPEVPSPATFSL